jgi:hypothetical protein
MTKPSNIIAHFSWTDSNHYSRIRDSKSFPLANGLIGKIEKFRPKCGFDTVGTVGGDE